MNKHLITSSIIRLALLSLLTLILLGAASSQTPALADPLSQPAKQMTDSSPHISSLSHDNVIISWVTENAVTGEVQYGTDTPNQTAQDQRGADVTSHVHSVNIGNLAPNTTYNFDLISGGVTDDNGGSHYQFTTGPSLLPSPPDGGAYGRILMPDGSTPAAAILYLHLTDTDGNGSSGQSAEIASYTEPENGYWVAPLINARLPDLSAYFSYGNGDQLSIEAIAGEGCTGTLTTNIGNHAQAPDIILDCEDPNNGDTTTSIPLQPDWNLISIPLHPESTTPADVLASIEGNYSVVWAYNGCDAGNPDKWESYDPSKPDFLNELTVIDESKGFWINMTVADTLEVNGTVPTSTQTPLCPNEPNLVGYPSLEARPVAEALASIDGQYSSLRTYDLSSDSWQVFDPNRPAQLNNLNQMAPGVGYWLNANEASEWTLDN